MYTFSITMFSDLITSNVETCKQDSTASKSDLKLTFNITKLIYCDITANSH